MLTYFHAYTFRPFIIIVVVHFEVINLVVVITYQLLLTFFQQSFGRLNDKHCSVAVVMPS